MSLNLGKLIIVVSLSLLFVSTVCLLVFSLSGCKKISYDLTKEDPPKDMPAYNVEFNQNITPAEGKVRKAY